MSSTESNTLENQTNVFTRDQLFTNTQLFNEDFARWRAEIEAYGYDRSRGLVFRAGPAQKSVAYKPPPDSIDKLINAISPRVCEPSNEKGARSVWRAGLFIGLSGKSKVASTKAGIEVGVQAAFENPELGFYGKAGISGSIGVNAGGASSEKGFTLGVGSVKFSVTKASPDVRGWKSTINQACLRVNVPYASVTSTGGVSVSKDKLTGVSLDWTAVQIEVAPSIRGQDVEDFVRMIYDGVYGVYSGSFPEGYWPE